jgi:hypothetical protein
LSQVLRGRALDILHAVPETNGFEAYIGLCVELEPTNKKWSLQVLESIMNPNLGSHDFMEDVTKWENLIRDYEKQCEKTVDEYLMTALPMERAPESIKIFLHVQAQNLKSYKDLTEVLRH